MSKEILNINIPYNCVPREDQLEVLSYLDTWKKEKSTGARVFLMWHRRAGKDFVSFMYVCKEMFTDPGIYYYFFPTYSQGKKVLWEERGLMSMLYGFHDRHKHGKPGCLIKSVNNQELKIELFNGAIFRIIGTDNIHSVVGTNIKGCIFSEYSLQDPNAWEYMAPILAYNGGWALFNGTPRGKNHFYYMYNKIKYSKNWYVSVRQTLYPEEHNYTGLVSQKAIEMERESGRDEDIIAQEYGCSFSASARGSYYNDLIERSYKQGRVGAFPPDDSKWTETAWDLGVDDPTVIWFFQREGNKIILIDYYYCKNGAKVDHYVEVLQDRGYKYSSHFLPHDGRKRETFTLKRSCDILRDALKDAKVSGTVITLPRGDRQDGINLVRQKFSRFYFNEGATLQGIESLSMYQKRYDPVLRTFMKDPVRNDSTHCADALRYVAQSDLLYIDKDLLKNTRVIINDNPFEY